MFYAYCIRAAGEPGPDEGLTGIDGHPVRAMEEGPLAIWLSETNAGVATLERLREHDRVVNVALRTATPLPMRFGTILASEAVARDALREGVDPFLRSLERVAGRVEMGLRVALAGGGSEAPPTGQHPSGGATSAAPARSRLDAPRVRGGPGGSIPPAASGRAYLEWRRRELAEDARCRAAAERILAELDAAFTDLHPETDRTAMSKPPSIGSLAHLLHRTRVQRYRERAESLRRERPDLEIVATGPWAPYSFV